MDSPDVGTVQQDRKDEYKALRSKKSSQQRHKEQQLDASRQRRQQRTAMMNAKRMTSVEQSAEDAIQLPAEYPQDVNFQLQCLAGSADEQKEALEKLRDIFRGTPAAVDAFIRDDSAIAKLRDATAEENCKLVACEAITNLAASHAAENAKLAVLVPVLVDIIHTNTAPNLLQQALWALGNIASNGLELRDAVIASPNACEVILSSLKHDDLNVATQAWFALSHIVRGQNALTPMKLTSELKNSMQSSCPQLVGQAAWALTYISARHHDTIPVIFDRDVMNNMLGVIESSVQTMSLNEAEDIVVPLMRSLGNASAHGVFPLYNPSILDLFAQLLDLPSKVITLETIWCIGNLTGGSDDFSNGIFEHKILWQLRNLLEETTELQREASFAVLNMATTSPKCLEPLINNTFHTGMFALLKTPDYDCIMNCLGFIDVLMVEFGVAGRDYVPEHVMDLLEGLQYHEGESIRALATSIIKQHFNWDEEDDIRDHYTGGQSCDKEPASDRPTSFDL
eukprot:gene10570-2693_t